MALPLTALVAQIENHLVGGSRGQTNYTYSREQIADEIVQITNEVVIYLEQQKQLPELSSLSTSLAGIQLKPRNWVEVASEEARQLLATLPQLASSRDWHYCQLPELMALNQNPVLYVGPAGEPEPWSVTRNLAELAYEQHRLLPRRTPIVYVQGEHWWFHSRSGRMANLVRTNFLAADPRRAGELGYGPLHTLFPADVDTTDENYQKLPGFPISDKVWETVKRRVLALYTSTHTARPVQANDQNALS